MKIQTYSILDSLTNIGYYKFNADGDFCKSGQYLKGDEVLRYYDSKFRVLNAKFVNLQGSRVFARQRLIKTAQIVQVLNPDITQDELRRFLRSKIRRYSGDTSLRHTDAINISKEYFGVIGNRDELVTLTSIRWMGRYPLDNPFENGSDEYYEYSIKERQRFALSCFNKIRSNDSIQKFMDSYDVAKEMYGDVCIDDVASIMGVHVKSAHRIFNKIKSVNSSMNSVQPEFQNKKYLETEKKIIIGGEEIHFKDKQVITKSRIHKKTKVSRPTINSHWVNVGDYFQELNNKLSI